MRVLSKNTNELKTLAPPSHLPVGTADALFRFGQHVPEPLMVALPIMMIQMRDRPRTTACTIARSSASDRGCLVSAVALVSAL